MKRTHIGCHGILTILLILIMGMGMCLSACAVGNGSDGLAAADSRAIDDMTAEELISLMPDFLMLRDKEYEDMPLLETQEELSEYALWNFFCGRVEFECRLPWELSYGLSTSALEQACDDAMAYYLFSSYKFWDLFTEDDGDPDSVHARVKLAYDVPEHDLEARRAAYRYVAENPVPEGGFAGYDEEMEYARRIHDYVACKVTYDPLGYELEIPLTQTRYDVLQEAYNVLGEEQETAICAAYARAFGLVCQYAGINCAWVWGNETENSSHAWNVIYPCDGSEPVLVDVTWDDGQSLDEVGQTDVEQCYFYIPLSSECEHEAEAVMEHFIEYVNEGARARKAAE